MQLPDLTLAAQYRQRTHELGDGWQQSASGLYSCGPSRKRRSSPQWRYAHGIAASAPRTMNSAPTYQNSRSRAVGKVYVTVWATWLDPPRQPVERLLRAAQRLLSH